MKKCIYILGLLLLLVAPLHADIHRMGSYNIRVLSDKDTGDKAWTNRKEYVARIITGKEYDVIGIQEMKKVQYNDLKLLLPDYGLEYWGRDSHLLSDVGEGVGVAWRTSRYTLLDKGRFFLSEDTENPVISWDAAYRRISVWVKLQDKQTDEIFYYCSTHLDNAGTIARREGARVNVETMLGIAGNYPCFICGDFNSSPGETMVHTTFGAFFRDSRLLSATEPTGQEGTYSNWALSFGSQRIDYIYCRKADVGSYATINEDFGRGMTPSDHFPVQITVSFKEVNRTPRIYVSTQGNDDNDGSLNKPLRTLQKATTIAQQCDTICVTEGQFYIGNTRDECLVLPQTLSFIGGYNDNFTRITGKTVVSGDYNQNGSCEDNSRHFIVANAPAFLHLENFTICDFYSDESLSVNGGAIQALGLGVKAVNTDFIENYVSGCGACIYSTGKVLLDGCRFASNRAITGGAIRIDSSLWPYDIRHSLFSDNTATSGAAIHVGGTSNGYMYANSFVTNTASQQGTFCFDDAGTAATITLVNNTFANNSCRVASGIMNSIMGGGIYIYAASGATVSLVNNTITGNYNECLKPDGGLGANFYGAAVYIRKGNVNLYNNVIAGNFSTATTGGDIYFSADATLLTSQYNVYTSPESNNIKSGATDILAYTPSDGLNAINLLFEGDVSEGVFTAQLEQMPYSAYVRIKNPEFAGNSINILSTGQLSEELLHIDLDNDGALQSFLLYDQIGTARSVLGSSTIGAIECGVNVGISTTKENGYLLSYVDGWLVADSDKVPVGASCHVYDRTGRVVLIKNFNEKGVHIGTALPTGFYIALVRTATHQEVLRFIKE